MKYTVNVSVDGRICPVTVSDENKALLAAKAAGGAIVGIWRENRDTSGLDACLYLVTGVEDVTAELLEKAARRHLHLPWIIADTPRLRIREFTDSDPLEKPNPWDCGVFAEEETRRAYIRHQYRFSEYGLWALEEKASGRIIGKAGITDIVEGEDITAWQQAACPEQLVYGQTVCPETSGQGQTASPEKPGQGQTARPERIYVLGFGGGKPDYGIGAGELGYHIYPEYRGQGFAEEACRAVLRYAEEEMELGGMILRIRNDNTASQRLAKKLGFRCNSAGKADEI
ncbi:MAG: GNAT family N-acetyltransferase [Clostridium sp.]|nr:GNAT family N-acetyltransferase [Clostridium sp.]